MKLGYARVSTTDQDLSIQRDRLYAAGCEKLFEEKPPAPARSGPRSSACSPSCAPMTSLSSLA